MKDQRGLREILEKFYSDYTEGIDADFSDTLNQAIAEIRSLVPEEKDTFGDDYKKCIGFNDCVNKILERMGG